MRRKVSVKILPTAAKQCGNKLYNKSRTNWSNVVRGLQSTNVHPAITLDCHRCNPQAQSSKSFVDHTIDLPRQNFKVQTTTSTTTVIRPLYRLTCVSQHLELKTGGFCWCKVLLPACPCWWQPAHSDLGEDTGVLLKCYLHCLHTFLSPEFRAKFQIGSHIVFGGTQISLQYSLGYVRGSWHAKNQPYPSSCFHTIPACDGQHIPC